MIKQLGRVPRQLIELIDTDWAEDAGAVTGPATAGLAERVRLGRNSSARLDASDYMA